jgi:hypothetical protein
MEKWPGPAASLASRTLKAVNESAEISTAGYCKDVIVSMALFNASPRFSPVKDQSPGPGSHFSSHTPPRPETLDLENTSLTSQSIRRSPAAGTATVASCSHCYGSFLYNIRKEVHSLEVRNRSLASRARQVARVNLSTQQAYRDKKRINRLMQTEIKTPQTSNTRGYLQVSRDRARSAESRAPICVPLLR